MLQIRSALATLPPQIQGSIGQIEWHTDPTMHLESRACSWVPIGHAQRTGSKLLHSSFLVVYAKSKRYLARPFPVAGARKNKMSSARPYFPTGN
ncbi:hypothetical protein ACQKWADRAFT_292489 [Trichoderma austrokoningii]